MASRSTCNVYAIAVTIGVKLYGSPAGMTRPARDSVIAQAHPPSSIPTSVRPPERQVCNGPAVVSEKIGSDMLVMSSDSGCGVENR